MITLTTYPLVTHRRADEVKRAGLGEITRGFGNAVYRALYGLHGPEGVFARTWSTGAVALCEALAPWGFLLLYFW